MNAHDIFALVLTVAAVIGVVTSIGSSAGKARDKRRQTLGGAVMPGTAPARPSVAPGPQRVARAYAPRAAAPPPPRALAPPAGARIAPPAPPPPAAPAPAIRLDHEPPRPSSLRTGVLRGLFEDRRNLVRAVVAMEVLGPPVALREQAPWSLQPTESST